MIGKEQILKAMDTALAEIHNRSYSARHPELGKMIKCPICLTRHRKNERICIEKVVVTPDRTQKIRGH